MEMIKISENKRISARELHKKLNINTKFTTWFDRMLEFGFVENVDFFPILGTSTGGRPSIDFGIDIDMAKQICMLQRSELGTKFRLYFIECEKKISKTMSIEEMIVLQAQSVIEVKGRVDNLEKIVDNTLTIDYSKQRAIQRSVGIKVYQRADERLKKWYTTIPNSKLFSSLYREIKNKFGVASYKDILVKDFDDAIKFIENWIEDRN